MRAPSGHSFQPGYLMPGRLHDFRSSLYHDFFLVRVLFSVVIQNRGGKGQLGRLKVCSECVGQDFSYVCWARVRESLRLFACCLKGKSQALVVVSWGGTESHESPAWAGYARGHQQGVPLRGITLVRSSFSWRGRAPTRDPLRGVSAGSLVFWLAGQGTHKGCPYRESGEIAVYRVI